MRNGLKLFLLLSILSIPCEALAAPEGADAQSAKDAATIHQLEATCAIAPCRQGPREIVLRQQDGTSVQYTLPAYPYLNEKSALIVYPGETITLSVTKQGDGIGVPTLARVTGPEGTREFGPSSADLPTLSFSLRQDDGKASMTLIVTNTVPATLKYDTFMYLPQAGGGARGAVTSACPLLPPQGVSKTFSGFEAWPHPILMLVVANIRALPNGSQLVCQ